MERAFDQVAVIKLLKDGIKKGYWTLEDLDKPSQGWKEVVDTCNGHPLYPRGYRGVKYRNLARVEEPKPKPKEEKVELTDPKDLPTLDF